MNPTEKNSVSETLFLTQVWGRWKVDGSVFFSQKNQTTNLPRQGTRPGCVCARCVSAHAPGLPSLWKPSRNHPKQLRPGQGNSRIRLSSPTQLPISAAPPQAPNTCSLSRTGTQQKGQIKRKPQSHRRLSFSCRLNAVPAVDNANTPPHQPSARGGGHLGVPGTAARGAPPRPPT